MARIELIVEDNPDGTVGEECTSDPVFEMKDLTDAQKFALGMLDSAMNSAGAIHSATADGKDLLA